MSEELLEFSLCGGADGHSFCSPFTLKVLTSARAECPKKHVASVSCNPYPTSALAVPQRWSHGGAHWDIPVSVHYITNIYTKMT